METTNQDKMNVLNKRKAALIANKDLSDAIFIQNVNYLTAQIDSLQIVIDSN